MLSEKLAKYSMIRDDKFTDHDKNRKKKLFLFLCLTFERPLLFDHQSTTIEKKSHTGLSVLWDFQIVSPIFM